MDLSAGYELAYSPNNLKRFIGENNLTRQQAADICEAKIDTFNNWCNPIGSTKRSNMPPEKWAKLLQWKQEK